MISLYLEEHEEQEEEEEEEEQWNFRVSSPVMVYSVLIITAANSEDH